MSISLYEASIPGYLQVLDALGVVMTKGAEHYAARDEDVDKVLETRLHETMLPFSYQVHFVVAHSLGAFAGMKAGLFTPPKNLPELDYAGLQARVADAADTLRAVSEDEVNALAGKPLVFRLSSAEFPFTTEGFLLSFSLPNLHFHATTAYALLRMHGVELGKRDYLGALRTSS
jgi:hypothetical protein